jgi:hypothetical protein
MSGAAACTSTACGVQIIQRDRLVACLHEHVEANFEGRISIEHGVEVHGITEKTSDLLQAHCRDTSNKQWVVDTPFLVRIDPECSASAAAQIVVGPAARLLNASICSCLHQRRT